MMAGFLGEDEGFSSLLLIVFAAGSIKLGFWWRSGSVLSEGDRGH